MIKVKMILLGLLIAQFSFAQNSTNELKEDLSVSSNLPVVSGFYNRINVGVLGGSNVSPSFNIINGYRFDERWSAGFGLGQKHFLEEHIFQHF